MFRCRRPARIRRNIGRVSLIVGICFNGMFRGRGGGVIANLRLRPHGCRHAAKREKPPYTDIYKVFHPATSSDVVCGRPLPGRHEPPERAYFQECATPLLCPEAPGMRKPLLQDAANPHRRLRPQATCREAPHDRPDTAPPCGPGSRKDVRSAGLHLQEKPTLLSKYRRFGRLLRHAGIVADLQDCRVCTVRIRK